MASSTTAKFSNIGILGVIVSIFISIFRFIFGSERTLLVAILAIINLLIVVFLSNNAHTFFHMMSERWLAGYFDVSKEVLVRGVSRGSTIIYYVLFTVLGIRVHQIWEDRNNADEKMRLLSRIYMFITVLVTLGSLGMGAYSMSEKDMRKDVKYTDKAGQYVVIDSVNNSQVTQYNNQIAKLTEQSTALENSLAKKLDAQSIALTRRTWSAEHEQAYQDVTKSVDALQIKVDRKSAKLNALVTKRDGKVANLNEANTEKYKAYLSELSWSRWLGFFKMSILEIVFIGLCFTIMLTLETEQDLSLKMVGNLRKDSFKKVKSINHFSKSRSKRNSTRNRNTGDSNSQSAVTGAQNFF